MNLTDSEGIYSRNLQNVFGRVRPYSAETAETARCAREGVVGAASRAPDRPAAGRSSIIICGLVLEEKPTPVKILVPTAVGVARVVAKVHLFS